MKVAVLGTGMVGRAHAEKLLELGYEVMMGTRDVAKTQAETKSDQMGNPPFSEWYNAHSGIKLGTFEDACQYGEIIFEALKGEFAVNTLKSLQSDLEWKILINISNPLDFSRGMPPSLFVSNTDSLGEQIQMALPKVKVVKSFNTTNAYLQVNPALLADGDHTIFISGNDNDAKNKVKEILKAYGWKHILDLGDITTARGTEMFLPLWLRMWGAIKDPMFNIKVVTQEKPKSK